MYGFLNTKAVFSSFFERLFQENIFSSLTYFFVNNMLVNKKQISSEAKIALGYIFEISLEGFIFLHIEKEKIFPSPFFYFLQKQIAIETSFLEKIEKAIIKGIRQIPSYLIHHVNDSEENFPKKPFCKKGCKYYLQRNWIFENECYRVLQRKRKAIPMEIDKKKVASEIKNCQKRDKITSQQAQAIKNCLLHSFSLLCGGPGCGKTYSIFYLIKIFLASWTKARKPQIILSAPTGKAAQKLIDMLNKFFDVKEVSIKTMTLHVLLKIKKEETKYLEKKQIDADLIIVDESSMIDLRLMFYLLMGISDSSRLILVGDPHQLPPIESENIFASIAKKTSHFSFVHFLTKPFRFENDKILHMANSVKEGDREKTLLFLKEKSPYIEYLPMQQMNYEKILEEIINRVDKTFSYFFKKEKEKESFLSTIFSFRILSCLRKGPLGSEDINEKCTQYFFKKAQNEERLFVPIIILQNDYQLELYNGTLGVLERKRIKEVFNEKNKEKVFFPGKRSWPAFILPQYENSYCLSVHKSQGSEFDHVLLIVPPGSEIFSKEMLYTAITRAKKKITIIAKEETIIKILSKSLFITK